jgi:site-specific DNA-adenine methylase
MVIPYMGSKRKLAPKIIDKILNDNPNCKYIYDLFGGGAAISLEAIQRPEIEQVYYNELDSGVSNLLKEIINNGVNNEMFEVIDRETFNKMKTGNCWKSGLIKTCWSFGNRGTSYIYSKIIEEGKLNFHRIIINACEKSRIEFNNKYNKELITNNDILFIENETRSDRRLRITKLLRGIKGFERGAQHLQSLQRLQHLEKLEKLGKIKTNNKLNISNLSYENVNIITPISETVIYLDPPYQGTGTYQNKIDYDKFHKWVKNNPYKIYISEYNAPFKEVLSFEHRTKMSATTNNKVIEKLYCNK